MVTFISGKLLTKVAGQTVLVARVITTHYNVSAAVQLKQVGNRGIYERSTPANEHSK
jgi:hypothetical protein